MIIVLVVHRKITAHSTELALHFELIILKMAGVKAQTTRKATCISKAFPWEYRRTGRCHLIPLIGHMLTGKEVDD